MILRSTLFFSLIATTACTSAPEQATNTSDPAPAHEEAPKADAFHMRFGSSHGMCVGYCDVEYRIHANGVAAIRRGGGRGDPATHPADQEQFVAVDKATIDAAMAQFDAAVFDAAPDVIGCPDCADGGRCWVEVVRDGKSRMVTYDCSTGSEQLKPFTDALWQLAEQVKWPETPGR